jgi:endoglycosylceramidase
MNRPKVDYRRQGRCPDLTNGRPLGAVGLHRRIAVTALLAVVVTAPMLTSCGDSDEHPAGSTPTGAEGPIAPLSSSGRWFTDGAGRVVLLHGVNQVAKQAPYYPAAFGFGDDDAAFLAQEGFKAVRLGVLFAGLMPTPGEVDTAYIDHLAESVDTLARHGLFVLLDFHQDGFGLAFRDDGFPEWMTITDGLPNPPDAVFPTYYITNPALQRAFEHFWANSPGPNGIGLQDYFVQGLERLVDRFAGSAYVLGYELLNEPWPGATWAPCVNATGCSSLEQQRLVPFYQKATAAVHRIAPQQLVFVEPFVLFNFGNGPTSLPGAAAENVLAVHSYALDVPHEQSVVAHATAAAIRDQSAVIVTEFGNTRDRTVLNRLTGQLDAQLFSWLEWHYSGTILLDQARPPEPDNVSAEALGALVRPYPVAITGTPLAIAFDPASKQFDLTYTTERPGGGDYAPELVTVVSVPARQYPSGYVVTADGARVTSPPGSPTLTLQTESGVSMVSVHVIAAE